MLELKNQVLSKVKKDLVSNYYFYIMVIKKTQSWRENEDKLTICSDFPQKGPWSAVTIQLNKWVANSVIDLGQIGS